MEKISKIFIVNILVLVILFAPQVLKGQKELFSASPYNFEDPNQFGQNRAYYLHYFIGFGGYVSYDKQEQWANTLGKSYDLDFGMRVKLRLTNWLAAGSVFTYNIQNFNFANPNFSFIPNASLPETQKLVNQGFFMGPYLRINVGKRGNQIGKYIDLGFFYNLTAGRIKEKYDDQIVDKVVVVKPNYIESYQYGPYVNIGYQRLSVFAKYRMNRIFDETYLKDASNLTIGIQVGLF